jgi:hypothetical protein
VKGGFSSTCAAMLKIQSAARRKNARGVAEAIRRECAALTLQRYARGGGCAERVACGKCARDGFPVLVAAQGRAAEAPDAARGGKGIREASAG